MIRLISPFFLFILMATASCGSDRKTTVQETSAASSPADKLAEGEVLRTVFCQADPSRSYALYIPNKHEASIPVLFLFDAHARGYLPVEKYKDLADRYGFILACSNNSKNGLAPDEILSLSSTFFNDVLKRLPADTRNIFAGGFSGGARVALGLAMQDERIKGVIANSAGFNPVKMPLRKEVCFVGVVGDGDFNLAELQNTQRNLNGTAQVNDLIIFNGSHEWAPAPDMDKAFLLLFLEGIRNGRIKKNDSIVSRSFLADQKEADRIMKSGAGILSRASACNLMVVYYDQIKPVEKYKTGLATLRQSESFRKAKENELSLSQKEQELQSAYARNLSEKDMKWWSVEVLKLRTEKKGDKESSSLNKRLLGYLSLVAYMNANDAMNQNSIPRAEQFLALYALVDPTNSEWAYLLSVLRLRENDVDHSLESLKEAVRLGFNDVDRVHNQKEFQPLVNDARFNEIIAQIKA